MRDSKGRFVVLDKIGEKYTTYQGYIATIISFKSSKYCTVQLCNGYIVVGKTYGEIRDGKVTYPYHKTLFNIGYLGEGSYKSSKNNRETLYYTRWASIFRRCYSEKQRHKYLPYKDVTVCEEWHNFQNFAEWFEDNYNPNYMQGWHLDKDILVKGNKIYSPETCCFVPREINNLFTKRQNDKGGFPIGVSYSNNKKKFASQISLGKSMKSSCKHLGYFDTPEEAFEVYKKAKEKRIKEVADKWKDLIDPQIYEAMYNYEVEITD